MVEFISKDRIELEMSRKPMNIGIWTIGIRSEMGGKKFVVTDDMHNDIVVLRGNNGEVINYSNIT